MLDYKQAFEVAKQKQDSMKNNKVVSIEDVINNSFLKDVQNLQIYKGKVSTSVFGDGLQYEGGPLRIMFRSDAISTHDKNRGHVPFKDQVLALNHDFMNNLFGKYLGNSQIYLGLGAESCVVVAQNLNMINAEFILRRFMARTSTSTSLYSAWERAKNSDAEIFYYAGHAFSTSKLEPNGDIGNVYVTPSTKGETDETVGRFDLIKRGIIDADGFYIISGRCKEVFKKAEKFLEEKGIVLVDTKFEFGISYRGEYLVGDEVLTLDSSRYWMRDKEGSILKDEYSEPLSYSKEFARGISSAKGYLDDNDALNVAVRYILSVQNLIGQPFKPDFRTHQEKFLQSLEIIYDHIKV